MHAYMLLQQVITDVIFLNKKQLTYHRGDYDTFVKRRREILAEQKAVYEADQAKRAHIQEFIDKFRANFLGIPKAPVHHTPRHFALVKVACVVKGGCRPAAKIWNYRSLPRVMRVAILNDSSGIFYVGVHPFLLNVHLSSTADAARFCGLMLLLMQP